MKVQIFKLDNSNSCIFEIIEIVSDAETDALNHFVPPFGHPEMVFYIGKTHQIKNTTCVNGFIKGQYNIAQKIDFQPNYHFISIRLHPFGLKQLFNFNASDLLNAVIDINEHPITHVIWEFLQNTKSIDVLFLRKFAQFIEQFAIYPISNTTKEFIKASQEAEIKTIKNTATDKGIGLRTLQRNFQKEVGLSPKEYLRIIRMNAIERDLSKSTNFFQIIADYDFTDQSHFIKEFKQLRDFTPNDLIKKRLFLAEQLATPKFVNL